LRELDREKYQSLISTVILKESGMNETEMLVWRELKTGLFVPLFGRKK
jgi:hypothetical protein